MLRCVTLEDLIARNKQGDGTVNRRQICLIEGIKVELQYL
jgi:hypothetical protein